MKLLCALITMVSIGAQAYVPTVEALFRHGANPDVTTNAMVLSASVSSYNPFAEKTETTGKQLWVKWIYNVTPQGKLRLTQLIFNSATMAESALVDKTYISDLSPKSFNANSIERGLFISMLNSQLINDGSFMVDFLRLAGVPVRLNNEIVNQDKVALLQRYRGWLNRNKANRSNGEESPMSPASPADRERVTRLMSSPMFLETQQVALSRFHGEPAWHITAEGFDGYVDDAQREIRQLLLRRATGEIEISCRAALLLNGTHRMPRQIVVRNTQDQSHQVNLISLKHYHEGPNDLLARLRRYDQVLSRKQEAIDRPAFLF